MLAEKREKGLAKAVDTFPSYVNLLSAMELNDSDEESDLLDGIKEKHESEMLNLPTNWQFPKFGLFNPPVLPVHEEG